MKKINSAATLPEDLFSSVGKPGRYVGGEVNAVRKDHDLCKLSIALAFPDAYEVGMSHLGLQILYSILNREEHIIAERVYAPWPDMERLLRRHGSPLVTLESGTPLRNFDMVGFSLQYELSFTNVLTMLDLGGIPLRRRDRSDGDPIVMAGGPCAFNPAPMDLFIDVFVIGEGEEVILDIARTVIGAKAKGHSRQDILCDLASIEGLFVPSVHDPAYRIKKRIVTDLNSCLDPLNPLAPLIQTVHDRVTMEIARGCTRGCRFCQAGMVWRPVRERNQAVLEQMADNMLSATGQNELSLLSLSSGDYSCIESLLSTLMDRYYSRRIALALPSLRVETLTQKLIEDIRRVRKTSFTLAPEAGTQRLRNIINKGNTEANLLDTAGRVFDAGWRSVKLYFMIGLPGETAEDMDGIADLAYKVLRKGKKRDQVAVSLSTFVPKAHTPFQWERQITMAETEEKQIYLKSHLRHRNIDVRWHDPRVSLLEGLFARGDEQLGDVIEAAFRLGCRFDGWSDQFHFDRWEKAMVDSGIDPAAYLRARSHNEAFPWDRIECGLTKSFLIEEARRAAHEEGTPDCRFDQCQKCGVCDHRFVKMSLAERNESALRPAAESDKKDNKRRSAEKSYRITFTKKGPMRFLSHLDVSTTLTRAISRAGVPFIFSEGFHPHPKISFASATPVGMESFGEYADIRIEVPDKETGEETENLREKINVMLPEGMEIIGMTEISEGMPSLPEVMDGFLFSVNFGETFIAPDLDTLEEKITDFLAATSFNIVRIVKDKETEKDIRHFVSALSFDRYNKRLIMNLRYSTLGTVRPVDILTQVLDIPADTAAILRTVKVKTFFKPGE
ncbi:MAG: hypothetical protein CSYNP_00651 [Syntrophus sp. SKADARSKE-3]|nr:hypothetical protein [Syntrophus sp. SKADARSKE-3]